MRIGVFAVGRMKAGPERDIAERYFERLARSGPAVGLEFGGVSEIAEARAGTVAERKRIEAAQLSAHRGDAALVLLDETGGNPTSERLAAWLARMRDDGRRGVLFAIGGADGHDQALKSDAEMVIAFGAQTWPHQLVRIMLAEQLYRSATILAGHPYHRG